MFKELRNNYYNEEKEYYSIDGWRTMNDNEEGKVLAKVYKDRVEYTRPNYEFLPEVIEIVEETKTFFNKGLQKAKQ